MNCIYTNLEFKYRVLVLFLNFWKLVSSECFSLKVKMISIHEYGNIISLLFSIFWTIGLPERDVPLVTLMMFLFEDHIDNLKNCSCLFGKFHGRKEVEQIQPRGTSRSQEQK